MVDFLMWLKFTEQFNTDRAINPFYIPIFEIFLEDYVVVQVPAHLLNDLILSINEIGSDRFDFSFDRLIFMLDGG